MDDLNLVQGLRAAYGLNTHICGLAADRIEELEKEVSELESGEFAELVRAVGLQTLDRIEARVEALENRQNPEEYNK